MTKVKSKNKTATNTNSVLRDSIICFETFREIGTYEIHNLRSKEESCFNGIVNIRKYKITIEPIEESNEILAERLQKLWNECDNYRHMTPFINVATQIGYELQGNCGSAKKK